MSFRTNRNKTQKGHSHASAGRVGEQTQPLEIHEPSFGPVKRTNKTASTVHDAAEEKRPVSAPEPATAAHASQTSTAHTGPTLEERFVWMLAFLVGRMVTVRTRDGKTHEGVLHTAQRTGARGVSVLLRTTGAQGAVETLAIDAADFVDLTARDVRESEEEGAQRKKAARDFATDTEISGAQGARTAGELEVWDFSVDDESLTEKDRALLNCDLSGAGGSTEWDQYKVNKERFGIETTYSPDFYSPHVDRTSETYRRAQREECEIMATETTNVHRLEDRGVDIGDRLTEEELYGGVIRDKKTFAAAAEAAAGAAGAAPLSSETIATASAKEKGGKYIPPRMREAVAQWQRDEKETEKKKEAKEPAPESFPEKQKEVPAPAAAEKEAEKDGKEEQQPAKEKTEAPVEEAPAAAEKTVFKMSAPTFVVCSHAFFLPPLLCTCGSHFLLCQQMSAKPFVPTTPQPETPNTGAGAGRQRGTDGGRHFRGGRGGRGGFGPRNTAGGMHGRGAGNHFNQPGQFVPQQQRPMMFIVPIAPHGMNPLNGLWVPPS